MCFQNWNNSEKNLSPFIYITCNLVHFIFIIQLFHTENVFQFKTSTNKTVFFYCRTALKPNTLKAFMLTGQVSMYIEFKKRIWKPKYNTYDINLYVIHVNIDKLGGMKRGIWFWICSQSCKFKFVYVNCVVWGVW